MKSFCANGHAWHAEFSDSLCPVCHGPVVGMVRVKGVERAMAGLIRGLERSVAIHGDWRGYSLLRMLRVIGAEVLEVLWALIRMDLHGRHGVVNELRDVAICCIKGVMVLGSRRTSGGTRERAKGVDGRRATHIAAHAGHGGEPQAGVGLP